MLGGVVDALAVVRIVFDQSEKEDLDDGEQRCLLKWLKDVSSNCALCARSIGDGTNVKGRVPLRLRSGMLLANHRSTL